MLIENNQDLRDCSHQSSASPFYFSGDSLSIDSLTIRNNFGFCQRLLRMRSHHATGIVRHMLYENNHLGSEEWPGHGDGLIYRGQQTNITDVGFHNCRFIGNVSQLTHDPEAPEAAVGIYGSLLNVWQLMDTDSLIIDGCEFIDNWLIDPDDYSIHAAIANPGRVLYVRQSGGLGLRVSNCLFEGNRQPNHCPELSYDGLSDLVHLWESNDGETGTLFENLVFRDNDDGTLTTTWNSFGVMRNIRLYDNRRRGLSAAATHWTLENVLVTGQVAQDVEVPPSNSWQMALSINGYQGSEIRNCTIVDCDLPVLIRPAFGDYPPTQIRNLVVADCEYTHLEHGDPNGFVPAEWEHSYLPELPQNAGAGIVVDDARPFELEIEGGFIPALGSALVDGGHPGLEYNDIEDPALPGEPLWPARGELRNDMGYTGGPGYFPLENWTAIEEQEQEDSTLPRSIRLLPPRPNPFNPSTSMDFLLPGMADVELAVYNLRGQLVRTLVAGPLPAGMHTARFQGADLASGVYIARLKSGDELRTRKLILLK